MGLIQPITDLREASIGAGFVLFAGRRATDTDAADDLVSDFDRHAAADSDKLSIVERRIDPPPARQPAWPVLQMTRAAWLPCRLCDD